MGIICDKNEKTTKKITKQLPAEQIIELWDIIAINCYNNQNKLNTKTLKTGRKINKHFGGRGVREAIFIINIPPPTLPSIETAFLRKRIIQT